MDIDDIALLDKLLCAIYFQLQISSNGTFIQSSHLYIKTEYISSNGRTTLAKIFNLAKNKFSNGSPIQCVDNERTKMAIYCPPPFPFPSNDISLFLSRMCNCESCLKSPFNYGTNICEGLM